MRSVAGGLGARAAAVAVRGGATRVSSWLTTSSSLLALTRHGESMPRPRWPSKNVSPPGVGNSHIGRALSLKAAKRASKLRARESARKASKKAKLQAKDPAGPMAQAEIQAWLKTPGIWFDEKRKSLVRGHEALGVAGHIRAEYTSRGDADRGTRYPVLILYPHHCVPEDETLWVEINALCQFAGSILDREVDMRYAAEDVELQLPSRDALEYIRPIEYIYVNSRFYKRTDMDNWPWSIACTVGNRSSLTDGGGFWHQGYRVAMDPDTDEYLGYALPEAGSKQTVGRGPAFTSRVLSALAREVVSPPSPSAGPGGGEEMVVRAGTRPEEVGAAGAAPSVEDGVASKALAGLVRDDAFKNMVDIILARYQEDTNEDSTGHERGRSSII